VSSSHPDGNVAGPCLTPLSLRNNGLQVDLGEARLISSIALFAQDGDTPSAEVMYTFSSVPTQGLLQLKVGAAIHTRYCEFNCVGFRGY